MEIFMVLVVAPSSRFHSHKQHLSVCDEVLPYFWRLSELWCLWAPVDVVIVLASCGLHAVSMLFSCVCTVSIIRYYWQYGTYATLYLRYRMELGVMDWAFTFATWWPRSFLRNCGCGSTRNCPFHYAEVYRHCFYFRSAEALRTKSCTGLACNCRVVYAVAPSSLRLRLLVSPLSVTLNCRLVIVPGLPPWVEKQFGRWQAVYVVDIRCTCR